MDNVYKGNKMKSKWRWIGIVVILLAGVLTYCHYDSSDGSDLLQTVETKNDGERIAMLLPDFSQLVEREGDAVVNIQAIVPSAQQRRTEYGSMWDFLRDLDPDNKAEQDGGNQFGTGFIISADGYILTNTHVVSNAESIKVVMNDKREYVAKLVGSDSVSDVALLKVEATDLPAVKIGQPKQLKVGEWVAAIGAPFGFDNSLTAGIVSAKGRSLPNETYTPFIQTDVAINPGNSGGPLFNLNGEVIGINSQIYSRSGGFMGISFAIPIDVAMNVAAQLKETGKVQRGQLGVVIQEVSYDLAQSFGLDKPSGALISRIVPNSPADKAGLQVGDIIRQFNGEEIMSSGELPVAVGMIAPNQEVVLGVWRKDRMLEIKVRLGSNQFSQPNAAAPTTTHHGLFTIEQTGLTLLFNAEYNHLVVAKVEGLAAQAGLREGDTILAVGTVGVEDEQSFRQAWNEEGSSVPLLVERNGSPVFLVLNKP